MSSAGNEKKPEYIDRERAKEHLIADTAYAAAKMLDDIPAADVAEVKHGEWIKVAAYNDGILNTVKCSICGSFQPIGKWDYTAYCPDCGAKMDGKKEGAASV